MAIIYRTTGAWGSGKGSPLTKVEVDNNFWEVVSRIVTLEGSIPSAGVGILRVELVGTTQFQVVLTDSSTQGPFNLPVIDFPYRGVWAPSTTYAVRDTFTKNGSFYQVLVAHTSALTFDPNATGGLGHDLYGLRMSNPGATLPTGGSTDMVMYKESSADFDIGWRSSGVPRGGANLAVLQKVSSSDYDTSWVPPSTAFALALDDITNVVAPSPNTGDLLQWNGAAWVSAQARGPVSQVFSGGTLNPVLTDAFKFFRLTNVGGCNVVIPADSTVNFPVDTEISFKQEMTGSSLVFFDATAVTLDIPDTFQAYLLGIHAVSSIKKVAANHWALFGLLEPV